MAYFKLMNFVFQIFPPSFSIFEFNFDTFSQHTHFRDIPVSSSNKSNAVFIKRFKTESSSGLGFCVLLQGS
jgi:hypothetical protein